MHPVDTGLQHISALPGTYNETDAPPSMVTVYICNLIAITIFIVQLRNVF